MNKLLSMALEEIFKGIGTGLGDFMKRSLTITALCLMLVGSCAASFILFDINNTDRREYKAEVREYAGALNQANRLLMEVQSDIAKCMAERQKQAAEIIDLQFQVRQLKANFKIKTR